MHTLLGWQQLLLVICPKLNYQNATIHLQFFRSTVFRRGGVYPHPKIALTTCEGGDKPRPYFNYQDIAHNFFGRYL